jgi:hypothetical protein
MMLCALVPCCACASCCCAPGPGTPSLPGLGRRCAVPKVMDPGLGTVESGWGPTEDCRSRGAKWNSEHMSCGGGGMLQGMCLFSLLMCWQPWSSLLPLT